MVSICKRERLPLSARRSNKVIIVHVNQEVNEFGEKVLVIKHDVGNFDGRPRIRAKEFSLCSHHILSLRGYLKRLEDGDVLLLSEDDPRILGSDRQYEDIYAL